MSLHDHFFFCDISTDWLGVEGAVGDGGMLTWCDEACPDKKSIVLPHPHIVHLSVCSEKKIIEKKAFIEHLEAVVFVCPETFYFAKSCQCQKASLTLLLSPPLSQ